MWNGPVNGGAEDERDGEGRRPASRSAERQSVVDRFTATLMFAGGDRRSAERRKVPLNGCVEAMATT